MSRIELASVIGFAFLAFSVVGTLDYVHELEAEAFQKELRPQRAKAQSAHWLREHCPDGYIRTYADVGPELISCLEPLK